jgi:hypothetical protein
MISLACLPLLLAAAAPPELPYSVTEFCGTTTNTAGPGAVLILEGAISFHPERARVVGGPANKFGALIYGSAAASPPLPWGNGNLCILPFHPSSGRFQVTPFSSAGELEIPFDGNSTPALFPFNPGETACFQYLYRDTTGWNLSNALACTMNP